MLKLNLGSADLYLDGYTNIDVSTSPHIKSDLTANVLDLSHYYKPDSIDEIWAAHLLEHLTPTEAEAAVSHWVSLLKPGGKLGLVTPDFHALAEAYLNGDISIKRMNNEFLYSYVQESHHASMWDQASLFELFDNHGLTGIVPIDRTHDPRLFYKDTLQVGVEGVKL